MNLVISGTPEEIAALVLAVQGRQHYRLNEIVEKSMDIMRREFAQSANYDTSQEFRE